MPGGVNAALTPQDREALLGQLDEMVGYVQDGVAVLKTWMEANQEDLTKFGVFSTNYLGMVDRNNAVQLYDGDIRLVDTARQPIDRFDGRDICSISASMSSPGPF